MTDTDPPPGGARGVGLATRTPDGRVLDIWFLQPELAPRRPGQRHAARRPRRRRPPSGRTRPARSAPTRFAASRSWPCTTTIADLAAPPVDTHDAYLRLHLLSHRLVRRTRSASRASSATSPTVVWTQLGPVAVDELDAARLRARAAGTPSLVHSLDKFPRMVDYVVPTGVRIADADRVRLGAHLAEGTTVMHEGFVNFNAGTLGTAMVEGRISQGVVVGEGSDLGGGASIRARSPAAARRSSASASAACVGANAGIGISLGDDCVVEAGLYVTAGTRVTLPDGAVVKARELSGQSNLLFIRNSTTGVVEVRPRAGGTVELNAALHAN